MRAQKGVVLVISLIFLAVMTLLVVVMIKTNVVELRIGGVSEVAERQFSLGEVAVVSYINSNLGRFSRDCLSVNDNAISCRFVGSTAQAAPSTVNLFSFTQTIDGQNVDVQVSLPRAADPVSWLGTATQMTSGFNQPFCIHTFNVRGIVSDTTRMFTGQIAVNEGIYTFAGGPDCSISL
ncbi:MAG: hypothetical protein KF778_03390 [Rhodocyclaceae bacterium]|nr:hypothetical protein [Rhodocyclaceae bacterium]MBX3667422.1 hypothetical protein [Rhodocyclaceae bacterium]